jgi:hypothetical protein
MKLLIKFPTRNRVKKFLKVLEIYLENLEDSSTEIIVSCDLDDITMNQDYVMEIINKHPNIKLFYGNNKTKIEAINADLSDVDFDILLLASDDMIPIVKGFDTIIKKKMLEHYPDTDGVLWFNDGYQGDRLNTLCILGKKYYDRFGYIYYPEYRSVWSDNEFMDVANLLGKQIYFEDVIIQHQHPDYGFDTRDIVHALNNNNGGHDGNLYYRRKQINFGL